MLDGDDRFIWNPGDGNDVVLGGGGADTLEFNGSDDVETFTISGDDTRASSCCATSATSG